MLTPVDIQCPHCGSPNTVHADVSEGSYTTIEDCTVCCRPMEISVDGEDGEVSDVGVQPL